MQLIPSFSYDRCTFDKGNPFSPQLLALVRFTAFSDDDGMPLKINEAIYKKDVKGVEEMRGQICAALEAGFDVSIVTNCDLQKLMRLLGLTNR
tara:strand:- start:22 stop:300 length:279 start_codon:yes stop_codon:yes gene_type:complete